MAVDVSARYKGSEGADYFTWQNAGDLKGALETWKFTPHIPPGSRVLDFGCGGGWILKHIPNIERNGVEPNTSAHSTCRSNGVNVVPDVSLARGPFDRVISNHCLEHVPHPTSALIALRDKMSPNGKLIVVVPIDDWRSQRAAMIPDINHHLHTWTPLNMRHTLEDAGFKIESIDVLTHAWPPKVHLFYRYLPKPLYETCCWFFAALRKKRQLRAVAVPAN